MPLTRITSQLISIPSNYPLTGSLNGTASYATTASFAMNGGSGGGGGTTSLTGITFPYVSGSNVYTLSQSAVAANDLLLSVNGVVQTPTTDYTVSASSVTFTDSYPSGSSVNVRYLVTATSSSFVDLANIVLTGTTTGDAYYPQVAALLHFDGTNGSTTITDNSKNNLTVTASNGAFISTAQSKFGGASAFFDGTNDYVSTTYNTALFDWWTVDYTLEMWVYAISFPAATGSGGSVGNLIGNMSFNSDTNYWSFGTNSSGNVKFYYYNGSAQSFTSNLTLTLNTWTHLTMVKSSVGVDIYVNGVKSSTTHTIVGTPQSSTNTAFTIGAYTNGFYQGYIDELRITKGYARYTGNFTPSTTAFSNTGGDVGKALVVNSTATGVSIGTAGYFSSQLAKAWVNFNGTGTVAIRDSYNVSSITDLGTGNYRVNFSSTLSTIPSVAASTSNESVNTDFGVNVNSYTTSTVNLYCVENGTVTDKSAISAIVFSN
jgi:hypothetical protein